MLGKIIRWVVMGGICFLLLGLIIYSSTKSKDFSEVVWDEGTTVGEMKSQHHFVMYTDLACPYCDIFSRAIQDNDEEFRQMIADKSILFEVRVSDFLYEYGEGKPDMSRWSAKGVECAKESNKFWDYYHQALKNLWNDYHSKGIGSSKNAPMITGMTEDYWVKVGVDVGMDETEMKECMASEETVAKVEQNAARAYKAMSATGQGGMPFFNFEKLKTSGFSDDWGWTEVKHYFMAGLGEE